MEIRQQTNSAQAMAESVLDMQIHAPLLRAVNRVATHLIEADADYFEAAINRALQIIGKAVHVDRSYIWENFQQDGQDCCRQIFEWSAGAEPQQGKDFTLSLVYDEMPFWQEMLLNNRTINGPVADLPENEILQKQGIVSILLIPIYISDRPWGFIGFDDCQATRTFSKMEEYVLQTSGILIISSILRNTMTRQLLKTGQELWVQDSLLRAVTDVAALLQETDQDDFLAVLRRALRIMCLCAGAGRASIWRNFNDEQQNLCAERLASWETYNTSMTTGEDIVLEYRRHLPEWSRVREDINQPLSKMQGLQDNQTLMEGYQSLFLLPLNMHGKFWGFIGFSYHQESHHFSEAEKNILRSGGHLIASAIIRNEITENLVEARESALASMRAKSEFLSRMSHEIRTPMNAIIGMTSLAQKSEDIQRVRHYLQRVDSSSRQLLSIINDVLDMSKIDANKLEIVNQPFSLAHTIQHVLEVIRVRLEEKQQDLRVDCPGCFPRYLISDELRLTQVLINLLSNAVKFTPPKGRITLKLREKPQSENSSLLIIEVLDTGVGIAAEHLPHIFQSFEQVDGGNTRQYGGTGLGLAICKRIVDLMQGEIVAYSEPGRGSHFVAQLPINWGGYLEEEDEEQAKPAQEGQEPQASPNWQGHHILLAEDLEINRELVAGILEDSGLELDFAENGAQAVTMYMANPHKYSLILMDVQMPVLDGLAATRQIRASKMPGCDDIPIYAMTANAFKEDEQSSLAAGMNGHLAKPLDIEALFTVLRQALN